MMKNKGLYEEALEQWGVEAQIGMFYEEVEELMTVLNKSRRNVNGCSREEVKEEIADVQILLDQLRVIYDLDDEELSEIKGNKLLKLMSTLREDENTSENSQYTKSGGLDE